MTKPIVVQQLTKRFGSFEAVTVMISSAAAWERSEESWAQA